MKRLNKGYSIWKNPFNNKDYMVSFNNARVIVFWTKNPAPMIPYLDLISDKGIHYYFQYTLNDYESEGFEPNVPSLEWRIQTFKNLSGKIGKEKVIWRFDPLILNSADSISSLVEKIKNIGDQIINLTDKLVISFVDIIKYKRVINNLLKNFPSETKSSINDMEFTYEQKIEIANCLSELQNKWQLINPSFQIATCAEDIDLEQYRIFHYKCIDDKLLIKLFKNDAMLMDFLGYDFSENKAKHNNLKDRGQRKDCGCIVSKDIGFYNSCYYNCSYCYANDFINYK